MESIDVINGTQKISEYISAFDFEVYDIAWTIDQFTAYRTFMYYSIGIYLLLVYFGKKWMENRTAFKLTGPAFFFGMRAWLFFLPLGIPHNYATSFWFLTFVLSKLAQFGDTGFFILRKQRLIALHWFHHATTWLMAWLMFEYYDAFGRVFAASNAFVHAFNYSYFALLVLKVKIPMRFGMALRALQIFELSFGVFMNFSSIYFIAQERPCKRETNLIYLSGVFISIFIVLLINLFRDTYLRSSPITRKKRA